MNKIDLTKLYKRYYTAARQPELVNLEKARYLAIRGKGDPEEEDYRRRLEALYPVALP
ncbi:hypothetical protein [Pedobacter sp. SYSU D00535]|uniref:hypothetical protein n=1 Tax=Pedobacter sp. SYSU D00535 TaxID=2810308 RepID=UPI001A95BDA6|nr:hypothetical protein [Pedobacter sp. SYSU D00535]